MSVSTQRSGSKNPTGSVSFWSRLHRYRNLLSKYWWILVLTLSVALFTAAWLAMTRPVRYMSTAQTSVDLENIRQISLGAQNSNTFGQQALDDWMSSQSDLIHDKAVTKMAADDLQARYPDMPPSDAQLLLLPKGSSFNFTATGRNPVYTQRYLQSRA